MRQEIVRIQQELGKTMVHVTHDQSEALTMASRIALLINGRIEQVGTPEELYDRPNNLSVAKFLGQPRVNVVDADIQEHRLIPFGIEVPAHVERAAEGSRCSLGLRPEAIQLSGDGEYLGDVISSAYLGDHYVIVIDFQGQSLTVSKVPAPPPRVGNKVRFNIRKEEILFFSRVSGDNLNVVTQAG